MHPHVAHARGATRNRVDPCWGEIERLAAGASSASTGAECAACCLASEGCDASVWAAAPRTSLDLSQHAQQQQPPSNGQQQQQQEQQGSCSLRAGFNRRHVWDGIGAAEGTVATESGGTTNHNSSATATATTTSGGTNNYTNSASVRARTRTRARVSVAELEAERDRLCSSTDGADAGPHIAITIPVDPRNPLAGAKLVCRDACVADVACTHFATGRVTPMSSRETCFL